MGLPEQRSLNGDLDEGLDDGRERNDLPNWGGQILTEDRGRTWAALRGVTPVPGRC
ncbi:hypothetical protein [Streptomyces sp. NPDC091027]|uniref:hypothetical protein n=1 Tax=Streptomyces sp. NPDC091027 TaxID=3365971 RepID=UPI0037F86977